MISMPLAKGGISVEHVQKLTVIVIQMIQFILLVSMMNANLIQTQNVVVGQPVVIFVIVSVMKNWRIRSISWELSSGIFNSQMDSL